MEIQYLALLCYLYSTGTLNFMLRNMQFFAVLFVVTLIGGLVHVHIQIVMEMSLMTDLNRKLYYLTNTF